MGRLEEYEIIRAVAGEDDLQILVPASGTNARTFYNDDDSQASLDNKSRRYRVRAISEAGNSGLDRVGHLPAGLDAHAQRRAHDRPA